jgi:hypothetical protein
LSVHGKISAVLLIGVLLASCSQTYGTPPTKSSGNEHGQVILILGLANVFSTGLLRLADELERNGVSSQVVSLSNSEGRARSIAQAYKSSQKERPVILVGHSYGADEAITVASNLKKLHVPVELMITFDATIKGPVPSNVHRAVNFYSGGESVWSAINPASDFKGQLVNINVHDGKHAIRGITHLNIEKEPKLHAIAIKEIKTALK